MYKYVQVQNFLKNLKLARKNAGFTQKQVEENLQLRSLALKDYETGRLKIPVETAILLCELYNTDLNTLFGKYSSIKHAIDLGSIHGLWDKKFSNVVLLDPIIKAHVENYKDQYINNSILEIILIELSSSTKKEYILEITKFMNSLIGIDGKVLPSEVSLRNNLLEHFNCMNKLKKTIQYIDYPYYPEQLPKSLYSLPAKHFIIWLLFFLAHFDKDVDYRELEYIEKLAEYIKVTKSNFDYISQFFYSEEYLNA